MRPITLVARREIEERLRSKAFYALTGVLAALILALGVIVRLADSDGTTSVDVGVVGHQPGLVEELERTATVLGVEVAVSSPPGAADGEAGLVEGDIDVLVLVGSDEIVFDESVDERTAALVLQAWEGARLQAALHDAGIGPDQLAELIDATPPTIRTLDEDEDEVDGVAVFAGMATAVLLFMSLQTFGNYVLIGVVEEKATAVVEVLLVRIRPRDLLAGKVIGIGTVALLQFAVAVAAGVASLAISGTDVPADVFRALPISLVWFLGGFAFYSTLFALAGSLVSRQEDAQAAAAPIMTVLIAAYITIYVFGWEPDSLPARVLSVIPPFTPFSMPLRMAAGSASILEVVVAATLLGLSVVGVTALTSRIYTQMLLQRGTRVPWREALRSLRGPADRR